MVRPMLEALLESTVGPLSGVSADDMMAEIAANTENWDYMRLVGMLRERRIFLIGAKRDETCPVFDHHIPLAKVLKDSAKAVLLPTDHAFSDKRIALARELLTWLEELRL